MDVAETTVDAPGWYVCGHCGARGVKLWRDYQTVMEAQTFLCGHCAMSGEGIDPSLLRDDGKWSDGLAPGPQWTDQIGWKVPAVPAPGDTCWGYTSVPEERVAWWRALPNSALSMACGCAEGAHDSLVGSHPPACECTACMY